MRRSIPLTKVAAEMPAVKPPRKTDAIKSALQMLDDWERVAFEHEPAFVQCFWGNASAELAHIYWKATRMKAIFVTAGGAHVTNTFPIAEWLKFFQEKSRQAIAPQ